MASVAKQAGLSIKQLSSYNPHAKRLKSGNLVPGQTLIVPTEAVASAATSAPDPSIERYSNSRSRTMHIVKSGETLSGIAKRYHTTTAALMRVNGLKRALILPGQSLVVPGSSKSASSRHVAEGSASPRKKKMSATTSGAHSPNSHN